MTFRFTTTGIKKSGYRTVELTVTRRLLINVDRRISVTIQPHNWNGNNLKSPQLRVVVDMPQGVTSVTERVLIPQTDTWSYIRFSVFEDGKQIRKLSITPGSNQRNDDRITETFPGWWFIDSDFEAVRRANEQGAQNTKLLPNVRALLDFMPHYQREFDLLAIRDFNTVDSETLSDLPKLSTVNMTGFTELPPNWLEYTCYDMVVISLADLQQMQQHHAEKWSALRTFVRHGATMVIYATSPDASDADFTNLPAVNALLDGHADSDTTPWQHPSEDDFQLPLDDFLPNVVYHTDSGQ
ncbi:hypothetical protein ACFL2H_12340, partial [Planctomycetota bacterium]